MDFHHKKTKATEPGSHVLTEESTKFSRKLPMISGGAFNHETEKHIEDLKAGSNNILVFPYKRFWSN